MAMVSHILTLITNSPPLFFRAKNSYIPLVHENLHGRNGFLATKAESSISCQRSAETLFLSRHRGLLAVPRDAKVSGTGGDEEKRALETVMQLYTSIKNQNICELSNMFSDECGCICTFFGFFQRFQGKQQVLEFFHTLITLLGENFEFVVQPTSQHGLTVTVKWKLQWNKTHMPVGKGFSFYILQEYHGKAVIRNVEMFMEPLFSIEPSRRKLMGYVMTLMDKLRMKSTLTKDQVKKAVLLLLFIAFILIFVIPWMY